MITAPLLALYAGDSGTATMPISDPRATILPCPCAFMCGTACLTRVNMPLTFVASTRSHSSSSSISIGMTLVMPALHTKTSREPCRSTAARTISPASCMLRTSPLTPLTGPNVASSSTATFRPSALMSVMTTCAPSSKKSCAIALPMPEAPPEISAVFPSSRAMWVLLQCRVGGSVSGRWRRVCGARLREQFHVLYFRHGFSLYEQDLTETLESLRALALENRTPHCGGGHD